MVSKFSFYIVIFNQTISREIGPVDDTKYFGKKNYLKYNTLGQTNTFSNWVENWGFVLIYQQFLSPDCLYLYFKEENQRLKCLFVLYIQSFKYTFTSIRKSRTTTSKVGQGGQNANLFIKLIARMLIKTINKI